MVHRPSQQLQTQTTKS